MTMPPITDELIASQVDERSAARGLKYAADGAIVECQRDGLTLRASCHGSRPEPYRVTVVFDDLGIAGALCNCPVGGEGACKHVAALLFTFRDEPATFAAVAELDDVLEQRSQGQLIELIKQFVRRQPALIDLVLHQAVSPERPLNSNVVPPGATPAHVQLELPTTAGFAARLELQSAGPENDRPENDRPENDRPVSPEPRERTSAGAGEGASTGMGESEGEPAPAEPLSDSQLLVRLAEKFVARPGFAVYKRARQLALSLDCWSLLRPIFDAAVTNGRHRDLRIRMYIHDGDVERALEALPAEIPFSRWSVVDEVARAAEASHPQTACALYNQYVEALIRHRGRDNYRRACAYLERMRTLHNGHDRAWAGYITELRARHSQLPALLDELDAARL